ncbi:MAG TPA: hypothetical protein VIO64_06435 [Pseudobacteroides sp.]|uniref:hypothetical protein n=1 Tax=Pseudobacteroides sp. TaxID=1968840 RepID=UPI002F934597
MRTNTFIFVLLCLLVLGFTACGRFSDVEYIQISQESKDIDGVNELKKFLEEKKVVFTSEEIEGESDYIPGKRTIFHINDEKVITHQFSSVSEAEGYKNNFDSGGCTIGNNKISWAGYPHFYQKWNLIVEYVGYSDNLAKALEELLGVQFSGHYATGN